MSPPDGFLWSCNYTSLAGHLHLFTADSRLPCSATSVRMCGGRPAPSLIRLVMVGRRPLGKRALLGVVHQPAAAGYRRHCLVSPCHRCRSSSCYRRNDASAAHTPLRFYRDLGRGGFYCAATALPLWGSQPVVWRGCYSHQRSS